MNCLSVKKNCSEGSGKNKSMYGIGEIFIEALPKNIESLQVRGRTISNHIQKNPLLVQIEQVSEIQSSYA
jgi:hypothetical protein